MKELAAWIWSVLVLVGAIVLIALVVFVLMSYTASNGTTCQNEQATNCTPP